MIQNKENIPNTSQSAIDTQNSLFLHFPCTFYMCGFSFHGFTMSHILSTSRVKMMGDQYSKVPSKTLKCR
jgi:hypothetical protein